MYDNDAWAPLATIADAHREWHLNAGVPMGTPGCPQDACHPVEDWSDYATDEELAAAGWIRCGHCKGRHETVAAVRFCSSMAA